MPDRTSTEIQMDGRNEQRMRVRSISLLTSLSLHSSVCLSLQSAPLSSSLHRSFQAQPLALDPSAAMSKTSQATKNTITLKGSAQIVTEFFGYSINRCDSQRDSEYERRDMSTTISERDPSCCAAAHWRLTGCCCCCCYCALLCAFFFSRSAAFCFSAASMIPNRSPRFRSTDSACR